MKYKIFDTSYSIRYPIKYFREVYWNIRNFLHRGKYGFGYDDVWNWSTWWLQVGADSMRYLAEHGSGYPGIEPFEEPEKWTDHLKETADKMEWVAKRLVYDDEDNEYAEEFHKLIGMNWVEEKDENGNSVYRFNNSPEQEEIKRKYFKRMDELNKETDEKCVEILSDIGKNIGRYWD